MMKKLKYLLLILLIAAAAASALAGCSFFTQKEDTTVAVTSIQVADSSIYMAPSGPTSVRQIVSTVFPENATNKKVKFDILTPGAANHITVDSTGTIRAIGPVTEEAVVVRVKSISDPKIYTDVFVSVVIAPLKRIIFDTLALGVVLGTTPQVDFKIEPDYATVERFNYEIINTKDEKEIYATIDELTGVIHPENIGTARVRVYTTNTLGETLVESFLEINIVYAPLDYSITVRSNDDKIYKQIAEPGGFDTFEIDIWKEESYPCNPNPEIHWLLNDTKIGDGSIQGAKNITIDSEKIFSGSTGEKRISVRLESGKNDVQILEIPPIMVYPPLTVFNIVNTTNKPKYEMNETIVIQTNYGSGQYPPDSYNWYLQAEGSEAEIVIPGAVSSTLYYEVDRVGSFKIICYPVVRGIKKTELRREVSLGEMQHSFTGNNISGIYIDGAPYGGGYVPYVKWDPIPYGSGGFTVQIKTGSEETEQQDLLESTNPAHSDYFTASGVYIPSDIADLNTSFSVKVKSWGYNFTDWVSYEGGSIAESYYEYLDPFASYQTDPILSGYNGYIANMRELGELLNYVSVFRPSTLAAGMGGDAEFSNGYSFSVYAPFTYDEVEDDYPLNGNGSTSETNPDKLNAFKLISAAFNAYADSGSFRIEYNVPSAGEINITLWFKDLITDYLSTAPSSNEELPFAVHYAAVPRTGNALPIDANTRTVSVSTSNQLYFAASLGYKPVPVPGSGAEAVYNEAREVLRRIIGADMNEAQKVHAIYDYLSAEVLYDHELTQISNDDPDINRYEGFYLEGVFFRGKAVCDGIAKAFNLLARMEGIASKKVSGYALQGGSSIGHAWNKVNIGGVWYIVDATWGSSLSALIGGEIQTHAYLLVTDDAIKNSHVTYGLYPNTGDTRHTVYLDAVLTEGVTPTLRSDEDITKIAEDYIPLLAAAGKDVYIELYAAPDYRAAFPINPEHVILQKIGTAVGHSDCWSIGGGYFVIKVSAGE